MYKWFGVDIMGRPRTNNVQINIAILVNGKKNWKTLPESIRLKKVKRSLFWI